MGGRYHRPVPESIAAPLSRPEPAPPAPPADEVHGFLVEMATALGAYGVPAHRLEEAMSDVASQLGVTAQFYASPTMIMCAVGTGLRQQLYMCRLEPGDINLARLVLLDEVLADVGAGRNGPAYGAARVRGVLSIPPPGALVTVASHGVISGSTAVFLAGGVRELVVSTLLGLLVGALVAYAGRERNRARVLEFAAALVAAFLATAAAGLIGPLTPQVAMLSALVPLLPGLSLTLGVTELATRSLVSGTARLMGAMTVLISLGFGVALGQRLAALLPLTPEIGTRSLPLWTEPLAVLLAPVGLVVLFKARWRELPAIALASVAAFYSARLGTQALGAEIGVCAGAFTLGCLSNAHARAKDRPMALTMLPGILLLVPGGVGYRGVQSFLADDPVAGIDTLFSMFIIAISLVAGLLLANVAVHPRRAV